MNKRKIFMGAGVLCLLLGASGSYYYYQNTTQNIIKAYTVGEVQKGTIASVINATGTINPVNYVDVATNVPGLLEKVMVKENDEVEKGQVIAYIDDNALRANVDAIEAITNERKNDYERNLILYKKGAISAKEFDSAKANYLASEADLRKARKNLADATIIAPMSGTIIGTPLRPGQTISQGLSSQMIICTIADLKDMEIFLSVDETDISKVKKGQKVDFTVDAYSNKVFHGTVKNISKGNKGNMGGFSNGVVYYTVKVAIDPKETNLLLPTMTARASIFGQRKDGILVVPLIAVHNDDKGDYVYMIKNDNPEKAYVKTGITNETNVEIVEGLKLGEKIVVSGDVNYKKM